MRVLIAPDKFKGTLSAAEAAAAMAEGVLRVYPDAVVTTVPMADGGEGTLEAALAAGFEERSAVVRGPLETDVRAAWAVKGATAVVETARACGLMLTEPTVQSALAASSYGAGQLILEALDAGATDIIVGVGGSAMTDGGSGALRALGLKVYDDGGGRLPQGGAALSLAGSIDTAGLDPRLAGVRIRIAVDVTNPLYGPDGAACIFAAQKGADETAIGVLDDGLRHWAGLLERVTGRDVEVPGAGAAGGFPASFLAFTDTILEPGAALVAELNGLAAALAEADLVITGEGSLDAQSLAGKVPIAVARWAHAAGLPVVVVAGRISLPPEQLADCGVVAGVGLLELAPEAEVMARAADYVRRAVQQALEGA